MRQPVVTFEQLVEAFPRITNKSKCFAQKVLPLRASPELAALVAALMTDGHVEWAKADGRPRAKRIMLYSSEKVECEWFLKIVKALFGVDGRINAYTPKFGYFKKQPYKAQVFKAVVARIMILAGAPAGNKTEKEFLVPEWIMDGNDEIKREFLRVFFSFEAGVPYRKAKSLHSFQMGLFMNKAQGALQNGLKFFSQMIELLNFFEVSCSKIGSRLHLHGYPNGKNTVYFTITGQKSVVNFYRNIGFWNPTKQTRLKSCVLDISKFHRIKSATVCRLLRELKEKIGTDKQLVARLNKFTVEKYSNRQMEHFRRNETALPLEFLWALIKVKKEGAILKELPKYVQFLYEVNSNALLHP